MPVFLISKPEILFTKNALSVVLAPFCSRLLSAPGQLPAGLPPLPPGAGRLAGPWAAGSQRPVLGCSTLTHPTTLPCIPDSTVRK